MPAPFKDISFPVGVARGATGGPGFKTQVATMASGKEQRNRDWARSRGVWDISTGIRSRDEMDQVIAHFYVVAGRAFSFRFKDWSDYTVVDTTMVQLTTTTFQLVKRYARGTEEYIRTITKPVTGTVVVTVSGGAVTPQSIDYLTGVVTFAAPPAATPMAGFQFDVPVRFDTDKLPVQVNAHDMLIVSQIDLVEVPE